MLNSAVRSITAGSKISHFEILQKLGEGGMGIVYKARDTRLDRLVAIKVLSEKSVANPERRLRLVHEAKAASALNHANIVTVHEIDTAEDITFIVMEFVEGRPLDQLIPRNGLRFTEVLRYAAPIAEAFAAAHALGMVHRDLKPANIMITETGLVKVLDFGLAKFKGLDTPQAATAAEGDATVTVTTAPQTEDGMVAGTVAYMSPEQAEGRKVDSRSDIFSFGITLYEMLTGRRPFTGETRISTMVAIVKQEPTPVSQIVPGLPAELERVLVRCLRKDPARRFQTMADLRVALQELREESDSGTLGGSASIAPRRKPAWMWAVAAIMVAAASAGIWMLTRSNPAPPQRVVAVTTYAGSEREPSLSPDGKQVAFSWGGEKGGNSDIWVKIIGETNALRLTSDPASDTNPAWSPDGKRIAFHRPGGIFTVSPLGGSEQKLMTLEAAGQMSWSPDGKWLAIASAIPGSTAIFLAPADGGDARQLTQPAAPGFDRTPAFSPDGRWLAYGACAADYACEVVLQELDSAYTRKGYARPLTHQALTGVSGLAWGANGRTLIYSASLGIPVTYLWRVGIRDARPDRLEIAGASASGPVLDSGGRRLLFSRAFRDFDIWSVKVGGGMDPVIVSSATDQTPQFSPDGKRIAFNSDRSAGKPEIWVAASDGSNPAQLINRLGRYQGTPMWSPDGRWIAFDSQGQDGNWDVYIVEAGGGRPRRITPEPSDENVPSWSRDGRWVYFRSNRTGRFQIWRTPVNGGQADSRQSEQMTFNGGNTAFESADGRTLYYTKDNSSPLFARPLSGGPERQILLYVYNRSFVPTEDGIYYIGAAGDDGQFPLLFFDFSTNASRFQAKLGSVSQGLSVSPDRKTILFTKNIRGGADLMMIENFQ